MSDQNYSDRIQYLSAHVGDAGTLAQKVAHGEITGRNASCAMQLAGHLLERIGSEMELMSSAMKGEPGAEKAFQAISVDEY